MVQTQDHHAAMERRGAMLMGFDQALARHYFRLAVGGGAIEIQTINPNDTDTRDRIHYHLNQIAAAFASGDFGKPRAIHDQPPPGITEMVKLRHEIAYSVEQFPGGGTLRIKTKNATAEAAIHAFLRFQIREHKTGDPLEPPKPKSRS